MTVWLSQAIILALHDEQLAQHGGAGGLRDSGLLESALARPPNRSGHGDPDTVELAALYAIAIARNNPFVDGNKRAAFGAMVLFLALNGLELEAPEVGAIIITLRMAARDLPEEEFVAWVRAHAEILT